MADGVLLEAAIAGVVVLSNITFGIIVNSMKDEIKDLNGTFGEFSKDCRDRHDNIPTKDEVSREVDRLQEQVDCVLKKVVVKVT